MMMTMIRTMYLARPSSGSMSTRYRIRMMTTKVMRMLMSNDMAQASHAGAALGHERARMEQVPARDRDLGEILSARSRPAGAMQQINGRGSCHGFTKYLEAEVVTRLWRAAHPVPAIRAIRHRPDTGPAPTANGSAEGC